MATIQIHYLAYGFRYLVMAANSALSLRKLGTSCRITVITDIPLERLTYGTASIFDEIILKERNVATDYAKFQIYKHSSPGLNLFLDCDTEVWRPIESVYDLMLRFDISIRCLVRAPKKKFTLLENLDAQDACVGELNTGVFFFRQGDNAREVFKLWERYYKEMEIQSDQPSFLRSVVEARTARLLPLAENWNARPQLKGDLKFITRSPKDVRILHYRSPSMWPDVAMRLAATYFGSNWEFTSRLSDLNQEISKCEKMLRVYEKPLFKYRLGRKLLNRLVLPEKAFT